jgi:hypothetical protein
MNVDIETEAAQFPQKKYIAGIFLAVCCENFATEMSMYTVKKVIFFPIPSQDATNQPNSPWPEII